MSARLDRNAIPSTVRHVRLVRGSPDRASVTSTAQLSVASSYSATGAIEVDSLDISIIKLEAPFEVIRPIPVKAEKTQSTVLASFGDANINASGETWNEAITNLKDLLATLFELLASHPLDKLGPAPRRQLAVLRSYIRKPGDAH